MIFLGDSAYWDSGVYSWTRSIPALPVISTLWTLPWSLDLPLVFWDPAHQFECLLESISTLTILTGITWFLKVNLTLPQVKYQGTGYPKPLVYSKPIFSFPHYRVMPSMRDQEIRIQTWRFSLLIIELSDFGGSFRQDRATNRLEPKDQPKQLFKTFLASSLTFTELITSHVGHKHIGIWAKATRWSFWRTGLQMIFSMIGDFHFLAHHLEKELNLWLPPFIT